MRNASTKLAKYAVAIILTTLWGGAHAAGDSISISVHYGQKYLDQSDWEPVESQSEFGVGTTFQQPGMPFIWVGDLLLSSGSSSDYTSFPVPIKASGETTELSVGARKDLTEGSTKVFSQGGLLYISAKNKATNLATNISASDSGAALGLWLGGGLDAMVTPAISVGGLIRISRADAGSAIGGIHFGLYAAYHFLIGP